MNMSALETLPGILYPADEVLHFFVAFCNMMDRFWHMNQDVVRTYTWYLVIEWDKSTTEY